ncbi:hypothetical protein CHLRE_12g533426v5 [Chlamydomonas reinhardtii]|uniref:Uncharacterized protein n=1 Tax=Chlamydomonas reinhardtii TaxID=3055 RepID=A0A2K3D4Z1_CHLRE|nr:uncharacterized protein CHLRE_12g533426v5 [Chlamydomonas reinhardtii]PNW75603.1 hypothetical protein CHLRE_12g533426v5 [Chlamydomonas reinhardtii]
MVTIHLWATISSTAQLATFSQPTLPFLRLPNFHAWPGPRELLGGKTLEEAESEAMSTLEPAKRIAVAAASMTSPTTWCRSYTM